MSCQSNDRKVTERIAIKYDRIKGMSKKLINGEIIKCQERVKIKACKAQVLLTSFSHGSIPLSWKYPSQFQGLNPLKCNNINDNTSNCVFCFNKTKLLWKGQLISTIVDNAVSYFTKFWGKDTNREVSWSDSHWGWRSKSHRFGLSFSLKIPMTLLHNVWSVTFYWVNMLQFSINSTLTPQALVVPPLLYKYSHFCSKKPKWKHVKQPNHMLTV